MLLISFLVPVLGEEQVPLSMRYGRVVERELGGDVVGALGEYRVLLAEVPVADPLLAEKILYRIGLCEQRLNRPEESRRTWRKLVEAYPADDPQVVTARAALKHLERELDRIVIEGVVESVSTGQRAAGNSTTQHLSNCYLLAGEWGNEPAVLSGTNGEFRVERKVVGQLRDGRRYGYIFAEHPTLPWVGAGVSGGITLKPSISLTGRVVDTRGRPVGEARLRVVGYMEVGGKGTANVEQGEEKGRTLNVEQGEEKRRTLNVEHSTLNVEQGEEKRRTLNVEHSTLNVEQGEEKRRTLNVEHSTLNVEQGEEQRRTLKIERAGSEGPERSMFNVQRSPSVLVDEIPLPLDALLPPVFSATNGEFVVKGLVPELRYVLTAEKEGYQLVNAGERRTSNIEHSTLNIEQGEVKVPDSSQLDVGRSMLNVQRSVPLVSVGSIVIQSLGEVSLRGRVVDDSGVPVAAAVAVWALTPVEREVSRFSTEGDGLFEIRDVKENLVTLKIESEGCVPRILSGLKPMGQEVDVVVRRQGGSIQKPVFSVQKSVPPSLNNPTAQQPNNGTPSLQRWLRGNLENGGALQGEELKGRVVVYHYGSAYVEASLRSLYPGEPGMLTTILKLYGDKGLVIIWVLPEDEGKGEAARMALELYPDLPVAVGGEGPARGNNVVGRDGVVSPLCSDQQLFKAVKQALGY